MATKSKRKTSKKSKSNPKQTSKLPKVVGLIIVIAIVGFLFYQYGMADTGDFVGQWKVKEGVGFPEGALAYFSFYENGTVHRTVYYPNGFEDSYFMDYWFKDNLVYMSGNSSLTPPGYDYEFSNEGSELTLILGGNAFLTFEKIDAIELDFWVKSYDGTGNNDQLYSIAEDQNGNIYAAGWIANDNEDAKFDWWIKKYDSNGVEDTTNWNKQLGRSDESEQAFGVATDSEGNVYVAGSANNLKNDTSKTDWWVKKFSSNGIEYEASWNKVIDYNLYIDVALSISVDSENSVYLLGYYWQTLDENDMPIKKAPILAIKKYDPNGVEDTTNWDKTIELGGFDGSLYIDSNDNVYIVYSGRDQDWNSFGAIKKYSSNGSLLWGKEYAEDEIFVPNSITSDSSNNIYVAGIKQKDSKSVAWWIKKFDSSGNEITSNWDKKYTSDGDIDQPRAIVTDSSGNVYVAGFGTNLTGVNLGKDWWIMKFSSNGNRVWQKNYNGNNLDDAIYSALIDSSGNLYLGGYGHNIKSASSLRDWWILKLSSSFLS